MRRERERDGYLFVVFFDNLLDPLKDLVDRCNHSDRISVDLEVGNDLLLVVDSRHVDDNQTETEIKR